MDFSRPLLLKGLGGLAAAGTVGGGVVYGRNMLLKNQEDKDKVREKVNGKLKTLGLGEDCRLGKEDDPYSIKKECDLDEGKLKAIKFSNKGAGDLVVKSSSGAFPEGLKLKFERKNKEEEISFSFSGVTASSPISIFGDKSKGKIILRDNRKFKEKKGKLEKDSSGVDVELKTKLEEFNKQLGTVNAPVECRFDEAEAEESVECPIAEGELKTMKFSGLGEGELTVKGGVPAEGLKLKVEKNGKEDISLSFTGVTSDIKLFGDKTKGKIVIKNAAENIKKFKVKDGKLTKGDSNADLQTFNEQLGTINAPIECRFDEAETDTSVECPITQGELKLMEFSNKEDGNLTVKDWPASGTVKLKVEKEATSPNTMSLSFKGLTNGSEIKVFGEKTKRKIIIKNAGEGIKKFKVKDNKLTKGDSDADLQKFNDQLEKVNAPLECRFDVEETEGSFECDVSKEQLKTMVFSKDKKDLTYSEGEDFTEMKLKVQTDVETVNSADSKVLTLTFKGYGETVKLKKGDKEEVVSFIKGTNPEFGIHVEESNPPVLTKKWSPGDFKNLLDLTCTNDKGDSKWECTFAAGEEEINIGKGTGDDFEKLTSDSIKGKNFELFKDQENFNQGFKFVFKGEKVSGTDGSGVSLEKDGEYEFRWKIQNKNKVGYLVKKDSQ